MKGTLIRQEDKWVIKYKMEDDLIATDGGIIPVHSEDCEHLNSLYDNYHDDIQLHPTVWNGMEVDFDIVISALDFVSYATLSSHPISNTKINLVEVPKEQLEKERNPAYKYFETKGELRYKDGTPIRSYSSKKLQVLIDEILDEEVEEAAKQMFYNGSDSGWHVQFARNCFKEGAKWMKQKLQKN